PRGWFSILTLEQYVSSELCPREQPPASEEAVVPELRSAPPRAAESLSPLSGPQSCRLRPTSGYRPFRLRVLPLRFSQLPGESTHCSPRPRESLSRLLLRPLVSPAVLAVRQRPPSQCAEQELHPCWHLCPCANTRAKLKWSLRNTR